MHDLDPSRYEQAEIFGEQGEQFEYNFESPEIFGEYGGELNESEAYELALELLEVTNEQELEQFLGKMFKKIGRGIKGIVRNPMFRAVGGALKGIAKKALPLVGGALGSVVAPGLGTAIGGALGSAAGNLLETELEGLSHEDRELEVAKRFVNLANASIANAAAMPPTANPAAAAQQAIVSAAQQLSGAGSVGGLTQQARSGARGFRARRAGRWIRRGRTIVLLGA